MIKNFIVFFVIIFIGISLYNLYPTYKGYIKEVLLGPEPLVREKKISDKLQFNTIIKVEDPITFINDFYDVKYLDFKKFLEGEKQEIKFIDNISMIIGENMKGRLKTIYYDEDKNVKSSNKYKELGDYGVVIDIKYRTTKGYEKKGNVRISLRRLLEGYYSSLYIKTSKNYEININFKDIKKEEKEKMNKISQIYDFIIKTYNAY